MYEVRPEGTFLRVDHDQSLARAVSKAEQLAALNKRRYVVVQVVSVHIAEPNERYIQRYGRANRAIEGKPKVLDFEGTVTGRLKDALPGTWEERQQYHKNIDKLIGPNGSRLTQLDGMD